jgi:hypothetical protein
MRTRMMTPVTAVAGMLGLLAAEARADVPSGSATTYAEGSNVAIRISYQYHGIGVPPCEGRIVRQTTAEGDEKEVFSGDLGEASFSCECGKWFTWVAENGDATGEVCTVPSGSDLDIQGTCPDGHACYCTRVCRPFLDDPCNGTYQYEFYPACCCPYGDCSVQVDVDVTWVSHCSAGQSCATAGAEGLVLLMFVMGAVIPFLLYRRRRMRR